MLTLDITTKISMSISLLITHQPLVCNPLASNQSNKMKSKEDNIKLLCARKGNCYLKDMYIIFPHLLEATLSCYNFSFI